MNKMNIKKYTADIVVLLILVFVLVAVSYTTLNTMVSLPSPIYGGDLYYQMGCINNIRYGGNPLDNCNLISGSSAYLPIYPTIISFFANALDLKTFNSMILCSYILLALSAVITYILFRKLFNKRSISILGVLLFLSYPAITRGIMKYTEFAAFVVTPFVMLSLYLFWKDHNVKSSLLVGFAIGVASMSHTSTMIGAWGTFLLMSLYILFKDKKVESFKKIIPYVLLALVVGAVLTAVYWIEPIRTVGFLGESHYLEWNGVGDMSKLDLQLKVAKDILIKMFIDTLTIYESIISVLTIISLSLVFFVKKYTKSKKFILFTFVSGLALTFSYFITMPLFNIHFIPNYLYYAFASFLVLMFSLISLDILLRKIKGLNWIVIAIIIIIMPSMFVTAGGYREENSWYPSSQRNLEEWRIESAEFIINNSDVNDVIITTKELGFSINALTGRKLVAGRRAHNDPFIDQDLRELHLAVILYGNNDTERVKLLKEYDIKYLYWERYWIQSDFHVNEEGEIIGLFDPIMVFDTERNERILQDNGIQYTKINTFIDPTLKSEYHPTYDVLVVVPKSYSDFFKPWEDSLDKYLTEVYNYSDIVKIYEIK